MSYTHLDYHARSSISHPASHTVCERAPVWAVITYSYDSSSIRLPLHSYSAAIRPRYDYSTTYVTIVGRPVCGGRLFR